MTQTSISVARHNGASPNPRRRIRRINLVLVIIDTLRRDHVGCYGNDWISTPTLDSLAAESARFINIYPEALPTLQVRQSIYTGNRLYPFNDHASKKGDFVRWAGWHPVAESQVTLAEIMAHAGYRTGLVTDTYHQFKPSMNFHRGFHQFSWIRGQEGDGYGSSTAMAGADLSDLIHPAFPGTPREWALRRYLANTRERHYEEDYFAPRVFRSAMEFVEDNHKDDFFLVIDSFDPHEPWDPPPWYAEMYDPGYEGRNIIWPTYGPTDLLSEAELKHIRANFAGEVTLVDRWLGHFVDKLRDLDVLDDTLLVVMSDHGVPLNERGVIGKYEDQVFPELTDIIMLIRDPSGSGAGRVVEEYAYDHDILPTVLARLGIEAPLPVDGIDLAPAIAGHSTGRDYVTCCFGRYLQYQDPDWWYIALRDGSEPRLYDRAADPDLRTNIAAANPDRCAEIYARLEADAGGPIREITPAELRSEGEWYEQA